MSEASTLPQHTSLWGLCKETQLGTQPQKASLSAEMQTDGLRLACFLHLMSSVPRNILTILAGPLSPPASLYPTESR